MDTQKAYWKHSQKYKGPQKSNKIFIIPFANASAKPGAVVVKPFDAAAAVRTMDSPRGPVNITGITIFHFG